TRTFAYLSVPFGDDCTRKPRRSGRPCPRPFWVQALLRVAAAVVRAGIAGPATSELVQAGPMVSRTIIADLPAVVGAWMVRSAVVRLSVAGWTEIVEHKRERERYPITNTLGPGGELGSKNQRADGEQKKRQPFHWGEPQKVPPASHEPDKKAIAACSYQSRGLPILEKQGPSDPRCTKAEKLDSSQ